VVLPSIRQTLPRGARGRRPPCGQRSGGPLLPAFVNYFRRIRVEVDVRGK
jgi:hypothetical protein